MPTEAGSLLSSAISLRWMAGPRSPCLCPDLDVDDERRQQHAEFLDPHAVMYDREGGCSEFAMNGLSPAPSATLPTRVGVAVT